jgi:hypothetical protein
MRRREFITASTSRSRRIGLAVGLKTRMGADQGHCRSAWQAASTVLTVSFLAPHPPQFLPRARHYDQLAGMAAELVHRPVVVLIAVGGDVAARAAAAASRTIPVITAFGVDPVGSGLVASLARLDRQCRA